MIRGEIETDSISAPAGVHGGQESSPKALIPKPSNPKSPEALKA